MTERYHYMSYQSASVVDSLVGVFSYKPFDEQLDWSFTARASPCYITVSYSYPLKTSSVHMLVLPFDDHCCYSGSI